MMTAIRTALSAFLLAVLAAPLAAQDPDPGDEARKRNSQRVTGAKLELVRHWIWGEKDVPPLPPHPPAARVPALGRVAFSANGKVLALELGASVFAIRVPDGEPKELASGEVAVLGPVGESDLLLRVGTDVWRFDAEGEKERAGELEIPDRSDSWTSPFAARLLECSMVNYRVATYLVDVPSAKRKRLPIGQGHPTAVAWHPDDKLVAIAVALFGPGTEEPGQGIRLFDTSGTSKGRFDEQGKTVRAMDFSTDGRSLTWVDDRVRRVDIDSGTELATAEHRPQFWANVDPVLAVSHDGSSLHLWDGEHLQRVRELPLDEERPELPPRTVVRATGVVLGIAITPKRDLLAVATFRGLRLYRIVP